MFGKAGEAVKVVALRKAARAAFQSDPPLSQNIHLGLVMHVGATNTRLTGDLDNFITGVCDGLMAAQPNANIAPIFEDPELAAIHPSLAIGILDDSQVIQISARKVIGDTQTPWYEVTLEGE